jgi:hypothetical protein
MLQPPSLVMTTSIAMSPMYDASLGIPFVHPIECDCVALSQILHSRRNVNIVRNQQRLPGRQRDDETLMPTAIVIIGKQPGDDALS